MGYLLNGAWKDGWYDTAATAREFVHPVWDKLQKTIVNNGVYRAGFADTEPANEEAVDRLFDALDALENRLSQDRYLVGSRLTDSDWHFFTTLVEFDAVYHRHFKCNLRRIADDPNLSGYRRELVFSVIASLVGACGAAVRHRVAVPKEHVCRWRTAGRLGARRRTAQPRPTSSPKLTMTHPQGRRSPS
jgi:glutathionyl-hydroquinone reductase